MIKSVPRLAKSYFNQSRRNNSTFNKFVKWTTQERPSIRESHVEKVVLFCVFGVTGMSSAFLVRPTLKNIFGIEGTLMDGPNSYRAICLLVFSPTYAVTLLIMGTLAGRHNYFAKRAVGILGRFMPKKYSTYLMCPPAKSKISTPPSS